MATTLTPGACRLRAHRIVQWSVRVHCWQLLAGAEMPACLLRRAGMVSFEASFPMDHTWSVETAIYLGSRRVSSTDSAT